MEPGHICHNKQTIGTWSEYWYIPLHRQRWMWQWWKELDFSMCRFFHGRYSPAQKGIWFYERLDRLIRQIHIAHITYIYIRDIHIDTSYVPYLLYFRFHDNMNLFLVIFIHKYLLSISAVTRQSPIPQSDESHKTLVFVSRKSSWALSWCVKFSGYPLVSPKNGGWNQG